MLLLDEARSINFSLSIYIYNASIIFSLYYMWMSTIFVLSMSLVGLHVYLMSYGHRCDASFVSYVVEYPIIYGSYTFINNVGSVIHVCVWHLGQFGPRMVGNMLQN